MQPENLLQHKHLPRFPHSYDSSQPKKAKTRDIMLSDWITERCNDEDYVPPTSKLIKKIEFSSCFFSWNLLFAVVYSFCMPFTIDDLNP